MTKTLREIAKSDYHENKNTAEHITLRSLKRIADSLELMAKDRITLEEKYKRLKDMYFDLRKTKEALERSNAALRGVITKMKKR